MYAPTPKAPDGTSESCTKMGTTHNKPGAGIKKQRAKALGPGPERTGEPLWHVNKVTQRRETDETEAHRHSSAPASDLPWWPFQLPSKISRNIQVREIATEMPFNTQGMQSPKRLSVFRDSNVFASLKGSVLKRGERAFASERKQCVCRCRAAVARRVPASRLCWLNWMEGVRKLSSDYFLPILLFVDFNVNNS